MSHSWKTVRAVLDYLNKHEKLNTGGRYKRFPGGLIMALTDEVLEDLNQRVTTQGEKCPNCGEMTLWPGVSFELGAIKRCTSCDYLEEVEV